MYILLDTEDKFFLKLWDFVFACGKKQKSMQLNKSQRKKRNL